MGDPKGDKVTGVFRWSDWPKLRVSGMLGISNGTGAFLDSDKLVLPK